MNGRSKKGVIPILEQRLKNGTVDGELEIGLGAMCDIALDRAKKLGFD